MKLGEGHFFGSRPARPWQQLENLAWAGKTGLIPRSIPAKNQTNSCPAEVNAIVRLRITIFEQLRLPKSHYLVVVVNAVPEKEG